MAKKLVARTYLRSCLIAILCGSGMAATAFADTITAPGLSAPGTISYDVEGIPTIQASTDNDVAFLQGYMHARDRFFQMDLTRRKVSGTLSELVGASQLASDVQTRTLGLRRASWATLNAMSDDSRGWLKAYANGVNFWLSTQPLPPEYGALQLSRADPWTPLDTVIVGKALAFQLSFDLDIDRTIQFGAFQQAAAAAHVDPVALFFGDTNRFAPPDNRVTIPNFVPAASTSTSGSATTSALVHSSLASSLPTLDAATTNTPTQLVDDDTLALAIAYRAKIANVDFIAPHLKAREDRAGSNEWVVSGQYTATGKPLLMNDPHLSLALPPVFNEVHLYSNDSRYAQPLNVSGVSVPGTPGVIQGCNQKVCWGTTTNGLDVTDTFKETFHLNSYGLPYATMHNGVEEPVQWEFQSYFVNQMKAGTVDNLVRDNSIGYLNGAVTVIIPRRNNGPMVQLSGNVGLSVQYTGWGPTFELESFRRMNRAQNLADFKTALSYFDVGSQNFAYSDTDGHIAYFTSAEAPVRDDLQNGNAPGGGIPPWLIRDGSGALHHDWLPVQHPQPNQALPYEILPASEMPFVIDPAQGYIANANNDPIGITLGNNPLAKQRPGGGIYYLNFNFDAYRMGQIDRKLSEFIADGHKITMQDMQQLQGNTELLDAELVLPHLLAAYSNASASGAWPQLAALAADPQVTEAISRLTAWDFSTPTGLPQGYDAGNSPLLPAHPTQQQLDASVAASIFGIWRSMAVQNSIDATLTKLGLASYLPDGSDAYVAFKFQLDAFDATGGKGAAGVGFFNVTGAPTPQAGRDYVLLKSLQQGLARFASADFAAAFGGSTHQADYHWGALHRIVFSHPLGAPFSVPSAGNPYGFSDLGAKLPGVARDGSWQTINVGSHDIRANSLNGFMFGGGPARRFVGEMATPINAVEVIPGGPSDVIGSPYYVSQLSRWLTVNYHAMPIDSITAATGAPTVISFVPHP